MKKRVFSFLLCLVLAVAFIPAAARAASGTGTENDPYVVTTYAELKDYMENAPTDGRVCYIKLGADLTSQDIQNDYALTLVHEDQNVVLDLAGHRITRDSTITVDSGVIRAKAGILTINDSVGTGGVYAEGKLEAVVALTSTTVTGVDDGTIIINGGTYENAYSVGDAVYNEATNLYINGGTFKAHRYALYAASGQTYVYGGKFYALNEDAAIYLHPDQNIELYNLTAYGSLQSADARESVWDYIREDSEVFVNGVRQTRTEAYKIEGDTVEIRTDMAEMIWITATTPSVGEVIPDSVDIPYGADYEIVEEYGHQVLAWMVDGQFADTATFEASTVYTLRVYVKVTAPITQDFGAWVNGQPAQLEFAREEAGEKFYWVDYTFPATASWEEIYQDAVSRLAGDHRWDTAVKVADEMKVNLGVQKFDSIIVASGNDFADALAGSYLSTRKNAPILLSWGKGGSYAYLDNDNINYIKHNLKSGGTVYILGGTSAVPDLYEQELKNYNVKRLGGANRFETNLLILEEAGIPEGTEILVCTSSNFADSLSAAATGKPIVLVWNEKGVLYGRQPEFLEKLEDCSFTVIGGENAVSSQFVNVLKGYGTAVSRLAGKDRFETSVMVAEKYFENPTHAVLAYAWNYPDGLCGGALAYSMDAPLILTMTNYETQAKDYIRSQGIRAGIVLGGEGLISEGSVHLIFNLIAED